MAAHRRGPAATILFGTLRHPEARERLTNLEGIFFTPIRRGIEDGVF
jgi:hypothetical protein